MSVRPADYPPPFSTAEALGEPTDPVDERIDVGWKDSPRLALIRSGALDPAESGGSAEVEEFEFELSDFSTLATLVEQTQEESSGPSIEDADVIVAGGRGLGAPDAFSLLEELAEPDRAGEPGRPRADDQHADLDPLVRSVGRRGDRL